MTTHETLSIKGLTVEVTRKAVKNVHLSVHPPEGRVSLIIPPETRTATAKSFIATKLLWIRQQQEELANQQRETPRQHITRESHYVWGRRYLLSVEEKNTKPHVKHDHKNLTLVVRPDSSPEKRSEVMHEWHKSLLHAVIPKMIKKWEKKLNVEVSAYYLQKMKTRWGSCNHDKGNIRINTELVKKPKDLLEYIIVHEMTHLIIPNHSEKFLSLMNTHYPAWKEAQKELNELPI
ncbi:M48 family metallopeptidase [Akkermansiaceae bacterium]|nr:M48 family metallopeptidase [Akkermansiaceae bacterium]